ADAEEAFEDGEIFLRVALPDDFARVELEAEEDAFRAEGVAVFGSENGRAARAVVVAVGVAEVAGVLMGPEGLAGESVEALDDFLTLAVVMEDKALAENGGSAVPFTDLLGPDEGRAVFGPGFEQAGSFGDTVV